MLAATPEGSSLLIERLKVLQSEHGFLPRERLVELSRSESIPLYQIESVASFYPHFRTTPPPAVEIAVCADMSCWLRGAGTTRTAGITRSS